MWMSDAWVSTARRDDLVDQADDRRLARQVFQPLGVLLQPLRTGRASAAGASVSG